MPNASSDLGSEPAPALALGTPGRSAATHLYVDTILVAPARLGANDHQHAPQA